MGITNLPPQAYTRDTLVKAIDWINHQPQNVRERAHSADLIVSHYLQARRFAAAQREEAPVSGENFKADLKHLAHDLKQFEEPIAPPPTGRSLSHAQVEDPLPSPPHTAPAPSRYEERLAPNGYQPERQPPPQYQERPAPQPQYQPERTPPRQAPPTYYQAERPAAPRGFAWTVDHRSLALAHELQQRMNLSSEAEALRFLIALGGERMRQMLP